MARRSHGDGFAACVKSDGTVQTVSGTEFGNGTFTLAASGLYYFPLPHFESAWLISVQLRHDAAIAITSATIEDCNMPAPVALGDASRAGVVSWYEAASEGSWIDEDPATAFVGTRNDGGGSTTPTNGVVAVVAGGKGGAMWHFVDAASRRARLAVQVGATGGEVQVCCWSKE